MPPAFAEPRLSLPGSGLYAGIYNVLLGEQGSRPPPWASSCRSGAACLALVVAP